MLPSVNLKTTNASSYNIKSVTEKQTVLRILNVSKMNVFEALKTMEPKPVVSVRLMHK